MQPWGLVVLRMGYASNITRLVHAGIDFNILQSEAVAFLAVCQ